MTDPIADPTAPDVLRAHAEHQYADELAALERTDEHPRPPQWRLSPWAVATYLLGGTLTDGTAISMTRREPRYFAEISVPSVSVPPSR